MLCKMKKTHIFPVLLAVVMLVQAVSTSAAWKGNDDVSYVAEVYNEESGLPTGEANTILQSSDGYIWIGSYGGLIRYDGSSFTNYSADIGTSSIRALFEGADGKLYIGTNDKGAFVMEDDTFVPISGGEEHSFLCVKDFAQAPRHEIYLASTSGIAKIDDGVLKKVEFETVEKEQFHTVDSDSRGNIWALSDAGNIYILRDGKLLHDFSSADIFERGKATAIATDAMGRVYIGSSENAVAVMNSVGSTPAKSRSFTTRDVHMHNRLKTLPDGRIMVCGMTGFGYLTDTGVFTRVDHSTGDALSANWAELDHEGNFWVGSSTKGVIRYTESCFDTHNEAASLDGIAINAVRKEGENFYLGTDSGILVCGEDWKRVENGLTEMLSGIRVRNITSDTNGNIWFATYSNHGALCYDPETGKTSDFGCAQGMQSETIRVVFALSDGRVLVGNQLGFAIIENGRITETYGAEQGLKVPSVLCAMELGGEIYVGTDGSGIYKLSNGELTEYSFDEGLSDGVVLRMAPDSERENAYFVCAGNNLYYCENDCFRLLDGLEKGAGSIYSVYDRAGNIWLLQNDGVFAVDKKKILAGEPAFTLRYGVGCGLTGTLNANTWNYLDGDTGELYLATRNGISIFGFRGRKIGSPIAVVNSVTVDEKTYPHPETVFVSRTAQRVTIDISLLHFSDTNKFEIAYQMVDFDTQETVTDDKHVRVSYTNIPGGTYTFTMRVIDPMTGEETYVTEMTLEKEKKPMEYAWVRATALFLLLASVAGVVLLSNRIRLRSMKRRHKELQSITEQALLTIARTIDAKDPYTKGHSNRVAIYSREMARRMGYSPEQQENIYYIGLLHDIGKIGIPDEILNKPGKLTEEERKVIQQHPIIGGDILQDFEALPGIADGARYHHERYDGMGYGAGKKGKEIPPVARIICIADSYDAMQSVRCYRPPLAREDIVSELRKGTGTQFDPEIVPVMLSMIEDGTAPINDV